VQAYRMTDRLSIYCTTCGRCTFDV